MQEIQTNHEEMVLGAALAESGHWLKHAADIHPRLFVSYRVLGEQVCAMRAAGRPTDPRSVQSWMASKGIQTELGNLLSLEDKGAVSDAALGAAIDALHEADKRACLVQLTHRLQTDLKDGRIRADELLSRAQGALVDIGSTASSGVAPLRDTMPEVVREMGRPRRDGIKTGIQPVDAVTGGFKPGELVVLGARPSMGKTALALNVASKAAMAGQTVLVFSLEMSAAQVCERVLADLASIDLARVVTRQVFGAGVKAITNAANVAHKWQFFVSETTDNMEAVCRQIQHRHGLALVVVDYLQLMTANAKSREQEVAKLSRRMKLLAKSIQVPFLVLSQLNRKLEERANKRPMMSDLRESGALEQDADIVLLLWRPFYYDGEADPTKAELDVAKHRNGPTGLVEVEWVPECARFTYRNRDSSRSEAV